MKYIIWIDLIFNSKPIQIVLQTSLLNKFAMRMEGLRRLLKNKNVAQINYFYV